MNEAYEGREELQAEQLSGRLEEHLPPEDVDEEILALAQFARRLPWSELQPSESFQDQLRQELLQEAESREEPAPGFWARLRRGIFREPRPRPQVRGLAPVLTLDFGLVEAALVLVLIAVVVIAVLAMMGPRIRDIFGSVYNSISEGGCGPTVVWMSSVVGLSRLW